MSYNFPLHDLNGTSPAISPTNALVTQTDSMSLSNGVSPDELQQQLNGLNAWASVPFHFDDSWPHVPDDGSLYLPPIDESTLLEGSSDMGLYINPDPFAILPSSVRPKIGSDNNSQLSAPTPNSQLASSTSASGPPASAAIQPAYKRGTPGRKPKNKVAAPMTEQEKEEEELNRMARDDDKRRRNTAASARFRVRKKEREAALEASAKTLQQKVIELEKEVEALKTENSWLRELIVQKSRAEPSAASKKE